MKKVIARSAIILDPALQQRAREDKEYVDELAELYKSECELPPLDVFGPKGAKEYFLADGHYRLAAAEKAGIQGMEVEVHEGDIEDAKLFSCSANNRHGLRPSTADKRRAVTSLLTSKRWGGKTDRWIADTCGVAPSTVGSIKAQLSNLDNTKDGGTREGRDGKRYKAKRRKKKTSESNGESDDEPKAGEEVFDFHAYHSARGTLRKLIDKMYRVHNLVNTNGSVKQDKDWDDIAKNLEKFHEDFTRRWAYLNGKPFPKQ